MPIIGTTIAATPGLQVGVERQKRFKMQVFRPWTLQLFEFCFHILKEALEHHWPQYVDRSSPSPQHLDRKWAWSIKKIVFGVWTCVGPTYNCANLHQSHPDRKCHFLRQNQDFRPVLTQSESL